jgi:hypothetical protein
MAWIHVVLRYILNKLQETVNVITHMLCYYTNSICEPRIPKNCLTKKTTFGNWFSCACATKLVDLHVYLWRNQENFLSKDNFSMINVRKGSSLVALRTNIYFFNIWSHNINYCYNICIGNKIHLIKAHPLEKERKPWKHTQMLTRLHLNVPLSFPRYTKPWNMNWHTPKLFGRFNCESKCENNERIRSWGTFPSSQHFGGRRACWSSGMGIRKNDKQVNYSHRLAQTK